MGTQTFFFAEYLLDSAPASRGLCVPTYLLHTPPSLGLENARPANFSSPGTSHHIARALLRTSRVCSSRIGKVPTAALGLVNSVPCLPIGIQFGKITLLILSVLAQAYRPQTRPSAPYCHWSGPSESGDASAPSLI